jgi:pimeloyl-ACP methyl ester carboxylesterase
MTDPPASESRISDPPRFVNSGDYRDEVAAFDRSATVGHWDGPRYRMTYRTLGEGPALILVPGIAGTYRVYAQLLNRLASRFRTVVYDYPGEDPDDGAHLRGIRHEDLVDDLIELTRALALEPAFLVGLSFGSTIVLRALYRQPSASPRAALQGGFAHRPFSLVERVALEVGQRFPGRVSVLPFRETILAIKGRGEFPRDRPDIWSYYIEQNGLTPIGPLAHRLHLLTTLDLRPILGEITTPTLLLHGEVDRIIDERQYVELRLALPHCSGVLMPNVGHQPHLTHADEMAELIADWFANDRLPG